MRPFTLVVAVLVVSVLQNGCETTESFGYYAPVLNADSIAVLIDEGDRAVESRDYETYRSLFSPYFMHVDESAKGDTGYGIGGLNSMSRSDYMAIVEDILDRAKRVELYTRIKEIEYPNPGLLAKVTVEEEEILDYNGQERRRISLAYYEIGFEDEWIFFKKYTRYATQEIK